MKLLWEFSIQTDHHLDHNRPNFVVLEMERRLSFIDYVACFLDTRVAKKKRGEDRPSGIKSGNAKDLELQKCSVIPL